MARLVTSDGVQVNLFLDLDSNNTGEGTLLYGPKSQPNMDFIVQGFKDFRTNTEFNNKNRLVFHCDHQITVNISSITGGNYPTLSNPYSAAPDTKLYYVGNDLVLSKTGTKIHRIDLFKSASTNIDNLEDSIFDGNYNSLTNKPTIPSDVNQLNDADGILDTYTKTEVDNIVSSSGGSNVEIFYASTNWTKPAGVTFLQLILVGGGAGGASTNNYTLANGGDTTVTFSSGEIITASGGLGRVSAASTRDGYQYLQQNGRGGFLGNAGTDERHITANTTASSGGDSYVYGEGILYPGGNTSNPDGDPNGWSGGASAQYYANPGNGGGSTYATLGGSGSGGAQGNIGGSGAGTIYMGVNYYFGSGGGGVGAGGGGYWYSSNTSFINSTYTMYHGGQAGGILEFDKIVPSESQTCSIVIGAGGNGQGFGGGGGQGIVIIKY